MLAGVDYVLMGAGIPWEIPGILDKLACHEEASLRLAVEGALPGEDWRMTFRPEDHLDRPLAPLKRPKFLAIISSPTIAQSLLKRATGEIEGFVVESPTAGGHNAPPRGQLKLSEKNEPVYGPRDQPDPEKMLKIGYPFWLAGSYGNPEGLRLARESGAEGIQVGTAFAFCEESGLLPEIRYRLLRKALAGESVVYTDPYASPTGFPFKVARLEDTLSEDEQYEARTRICDLGYLRRIYRKEDGTLGYRCPSEPISTWVKKGGAPEETEFRKCLCNGLMANVGLAQTQKTGYVEQPLVTAGDDLSKLSPLFSEEKLEYHASDVLAFLMAPLAASS
jgi:nitronate monooxygenase